MCGVCILKPLSTAITRGEHVEEYNRMRWSDLAGEEAQVSSAAEESENEEKTKLQSA